MPPAVLLAVAMLASAAPVPKAVKEANWLPTAVGTKWEYILYGNEQSVNTEEVTAVEEKEGVTTVTLGVSHSSGTNETKSYRLAGGNLALARDGILDYDPTWVLAKTGMKAGDEWEATTAFTMLVQGNVRRVGLGGTMTVGKSEEVATPAGKFTAIPVTHKRGRNEAVFWFADGVGLVRHTQSGQKEPRLELKSFTPGKK